MTSLLCRNSSNISKAKLHAVMLLSDWNQKISERWESSGSCQMNRADVNHWAKNIIEWYDKSVRVNRQEWCRLRKELRSGQFAVSVAHWMKNTSSIYNRLYSIYSDRLPKKGIYIWEGKPSLSTKVNKMCLKICMLLSNLRLNYCVECFSLYLWYNCVKSCI